MKKTTRVLIVGAGVAGQMVTEEIRRHPETRYAPVAFIDDDPLKQGRTIAGLPVIGAQHEIADAVVKGEIDEILIAIPSADGTTIRNIIDHCEKARVSFKIVPGIYEIILGDVTINQVREVHPEDLLGRETVELDMEPIAEYLTNRNVLITGAGGSIGSTLARKVASFNPKRLILYCRGENSLFNIENELIEKNPSCALVSVIGDITDQGRVRHIFEKYKPDVVLHAAAHKHVVFMEDNPTEAVKNNIIGTLNLARAALEFEVQRFIMLSTDKAVNPSSIMGASKRLAERYILGLHEPGQSCKFMAVRFGNVIGSRGSVVPRFMNQIRNRQPVTITNPEAVRYFMTISEAANLVLQAGAIGEGGEIFVLDMGQPIKIGQLARQLIILAGFEPDTDIKIKNIGLRQGEKLHEELLGSKEELTSTSHQKIMKALPDIIEREVLDSLLVRLNEAVERNDSDRVYRLFGEVFEGFLLKNRKIS